MLRHVPHNTPAEDIYHGLIDLGLDVITFKQMWASRLSSVEGTATIIRPFFLITSTRTTKYQETFILQGLCQVEAYKERDALTQCHIWANCKQPPRRLCCTGGDLQKDCPERHNACSTLECCQLLTSRKKYCTVLQPPQLQACQERQKRALPECIQSYIWKGVPIMYRPGC
jgi:hypothetical protein